MTFHRHTHFCCSHVPHGVHKACIVAQEAAKNGLECIVSVPVGNLSATPIGLIITSYCIASSYVP